MKPFDWNDGKNVKLKEERGISFTDILYYVEKGEILDLVPHPLQAKYPGQKMFIVAIDNYAYLVPFIETDDSVFLKTIIPSRKATKKYLKR
ncbi:MAG: toxin [Elusimicrobiota bacterium]|nr:toxin [Elusimicrobiota bacterium]